MNIHCFSMAGRRLDSRVPKPAHEQVAALAYQLHIGGGGRLGASWEDWLFAEYILSELEAAAGGQQQFQANDAQPPAMAPLQMATAQAEGSDRWKGTNE